MLRPRLQTELHRDLFPGWEGERKNGTDFLAQRHANSPHSPLQVNCTDMQAMLGMTPM